MSGFLMRGRTNSRRHGSRFLSTAAVNVWRGRTCPGRRHVSLVNLLNNTHPNQQRTTLLLFTWIHQHRYSSASSTLLSSLLSSPPLTNTNYQQQSIRTKTTFRPPYSPSSPDGKSSGETASSSTSASSSAASSVSKQFIHSSPVLGGEESQKLYGKLKIRVRTDEDASLLIRHLKMKERIILQRILNESIVAEPVPTSVESSADYAGAESITNEDMKAVFWINCLPFIGFGFLDNLIMIIAGDIIDKNLGIILGISTMAAAGIGNIISDVAGVGLAHQVESLVNRLGISSPSLTSEQWDSPKVRRKANFGKIFGLTLGCVIGMFPLLLIDQTEHPNDIDVEEK